MAGDDSALGHFPWAAFPTARHLPQHWLWAQWRALPGLLRLVLQSQTTAVLGDGIGAKQREKLFDINTKMEPELKDEKLKKAPYLQSC